MVAPYLSPRAAAEARPELGNADWYRAMLKQGKLLGFKVNGRWYTTLADIDAMVTAATNQPGRRRKRRAA